MTDETAQSSRTGIEILIAWANEQDHWVRAIVSEVVAVRRELPEKSIEAAYVLLLAEKGLSADASPNVPPLSEANSTTEASDDLRLVRLSGLAGVNALASGQEIVFNAKMTVLFGENAAGKTGYVRVLKRLAAVRSAQPILANIRGSSPGGAPHAALDYSLSGTEKVLDWNDEVGVPPFTRMSVFDSTAVALHVDDDLTYVFTPGELALFLYVHRAIEAVKGRLEREKNDAQPKATNPFLHRFHRDSVVYSKVETLGPASSIQELEQLARVSSEEKDGIQTIRDRVEALQPRAADSRLQVATSDRGMYGALRDAARAVASFPWAEYNAAVADVRAAEERYRAASQLAFAGTDIPGIFGDPWKDFIVAGETYLRDVGVHDHVVEGDACPYCRQGLTATAIALVQKYRDFCNNEPKKALDTAAAKVKRLAAPVASLQITALKGTVEQRQANFTDAAAVPPALPKAVAFLNELEPARVDLSAARQTAYEAISEIADSLGNEFAAAMAKADEAIADLRKQADERKKELEAEALKLRVLENRVTLQALLPDVRKYVELAQWAGRATPLLNRATAVLRSLTEQSKLASKELLDKDFERLFEAECRALRAPTVRLDFAGRRGQAARKKTLDSEHRLSDILSEGEQKVIALADFLAEAGLQRTVAPVIFDDPVNSLDYKRLQHVVDRLVELSATRQVVVFTHNIWFAAEILSRFEKSTAACTYYGVSEAGGTTGIVNRGSHPRWDTVKNLSGRINQLAQSAGAAAGEAQSALVESAYGEIRSWCEVVVEQEMLAGVTQRFQPNVAMTKLPQIKAEKLIATRDVILPLFEKACRIMAAHSQPLETLAVRPTLAELRTDWAGAQQARDAYLK